VTRDTAASAIGALVFSLALAIASVALPLLALDAGYSHPEIGLLTAASAVAQMSVRTVLGAVMRRLPDWTLITAAGLLLAASSGLVAASAAVVPFVAAQLMQGVARACFWTGSQTHVVRGPGRAVGALATVNFVASVGLLAGPVAAGVLTERSPRLALAAAAGVALAGVDPTLLLDGLPPFSPPPDRPPGRIWRRPGVDAGCWAGITAGAWRGLLGSYIPVALDAARQSPTMIGVLVSTANGASLVGSGAVARVRTEAAARVLALGTLAASLGTAASGLAASQATLAGTALALSGLGAGALQTLGPAVASEAVHPEERGEAIAAAGAFRAAALFAAPLAVAAALSVLTLASAMAAVGLVIAVPAATARRIGQGGRATQPAVGGRSRPGGPERRDAPVAAPAWRQENMTNH
jgi:MFS family permease